MMSEEKGQQLLEITGAFIRDQKISCSEAVYQSDRVILNAYELIEKLCDVVGYFHYEDD